MVRVAALGAPHSALADPHSATRISHSRTRISHSATRISHSARGNQEAAVVETGGRVEVKFGFVIKHENHWSNRGGLLLLRRRSLGQLPPDLPRQQQVLPHQRDAVGVGHAQRGVGKVLLHVHVEVHLEVVQAAEVLAHPPGPGERPLRGPGSGAARQQRARCLGPRSVSGGKWKYLAASSCALSTESIRIRLSTDVPLEGSLNLAGC